MTKKEYMQPSIEILEADLNQLILTVSVTMVSTDGLDDDDLTVGDGDSKTGDAWSDAW